MGHSLVPISSVSLYLLWIFEQNVKSAIYLWPLLKFHTDKNVLLFSGFIHKNFEENMADLQIAHVKCIWHKGMLFRSLKRWRNFEKIVKQCSLHDAILICIYFLCSYILVRENSHPNCFFFSFFFFFFFLMGEVFTWDKVLLYCLDCSLLSSNLLIHLLIAGITRVAFIPNLVFSLFHHLEHWQASQTRIWPSDVSSFHPVREFLADHQPFLEVRCRLGIHIRKCSLLHRFARAGVVLITLVGCLGNCFYFPAVITLCCVSQPPSVSLETVLK